MSKRAYYRALYGEAWKTMDAEKMLSAVADGFVLNDPALPEPVTKATLAAYPDNLHTFTLATFQYKMGACLRRFTSRNGARTA
jgi:hypothetical protein